jgi:hypothetical protein
MPGSVGKNRLRFRFECFQDRLDLVGVFEVFVGNVCKQPGKRWLDEGAVKTRQEGKASKVPFNRAAPAMVPKVAFRFRGAFLQFLRPFRRLVEVEFQLFSFALPGIGGGFGQ